MDPGRTGDVSATRKVQRLIMWAGEATTDDRTLRCVKLADKSDMMTTYRARQGAGNDLVWSRGLASPVVHPCCE